jgi:23S rRNA (uracil1939-C5)-methyltransferase
MKPITADITVNITGLSHEGRGIAAINGKTSFIHGALPEEKVTCHLTKKHSRYNEGIAVDILTPASTRTTPECAHFGLCGGCSLQHMQTDAQIIFKQKVVLEQLQHFGQIQPEEILPPLTGASWGYRGKARLGVRYVRKKGKLLVGFREKFSNYLADITTCPVLHPSIGTRLTALSTLIASLTQYEHIPQIETAVGAEGTALVFRHMTPLPEEDLEKLRAFGEAQQMHIYLQPNRPDPIHKIWPQNQLPLLHYELPEYQLKMHFHPLDFTQVNMEVNQQMIQQALRLLELQSTDQVLDLFCGLGNFTLPMARYAGKVIGIEGSEEMVQRAQENARLNQINNTNFYSSNLMEPSTVAAWMQSYDKILLDPPRTGAKEIIAHFEKFAARRVVYVSCNPATLARDAKELVHTHGYTLKKAGVINMFPHTSHIEAMALFVK